MNQRRFEADDQTELLKKVYVNNLEEEENEKPIEFGGRLGKLFASTQYTF